MNASIFNILAVGIRAAGSKNPRTGIVHGGIYFPAITLADGRNISARWEGNFFINNLGWTDGEGVVHEPSNDMIRLTAWNGKNSAAGKGLADTFAKIIGVGKELTCSLRLNQYMKRLIINNVPQADSTGAPITYPAYNFTVAGDIRWGDDSANLIATEIATWMANPTMQKASFSSRPPFWNITNHADAIKWQDYAKQRMASTYRGGATYGYARVMVPEGATVINQAQPESLVGNLPNMPGLPAGIDANMLAAIAAALGTAGITPGGVGAETLPTSGTTQPVTGVTEPLTTAAGAMMEEMPI